MLTVEMFEEVSEYVDQNRSILDKIIKLKFEFDVLDRISDNNNYIKSLPTTNRGKPDSDWDLDSVCIGFYCIEINCSFEEYNERTQYDLIFMSFEDFLNLETYHANLTGKVERERKRVSAILKRNNEVYRKSEQDHKYQEYLKLKATFEDT